MKQKQTETSEESGDELQIYNLLYRFAWIALAGGMAVLFLGVLGFAEGDHIARGISGAAVVWRRSIMVLLIAAVCAWLRCRAMGDGNGIKNFWCAAWPIFLLFALYLGLLNACLAVARLPHMPGLITGHDAPQYFAWLHTWVFDWDVRFEEEYAAIPGITAVMENAHSGEVDWNVAPVGAPLLWLPFYLAGHAGVGIFRLFGADIAANGLSSPYAAAVAFGSNTLVFLGMLLIFQSLKRLVSGRAAFFTILALYGGSPLLAYVLNEAWMSHGPSFFAGALVFFLWSRQNGTRTTRDWAILGAAIGLAMAVRPAQAAFLVLPMLELGTRLRSKEDSPAATARSFGLCLAGAMAVFSIQLLMWLARSGFSPPPGSPMQWFSPSVLSVLFSSRSGLLAWHPLLWLGILGLPLLWKKSRSLALGCGAVFLLTVYCNSAIQSWWGGASFGMRRFIGVLPFLAPAIALAGSWLVHHFQRYAAYAVLLVLGGVAVFNYFSLVQYRDNWFAPGAPVPFGEVMKYNSQQFHRHFGNPASFPMNLLYGWWHGVSPAQYDVLGGMTHFENFDFDQNNPRLSGLLGDGWEKHHKSTYLPGQPIMAIAPRASLLLPLEAGRSYQLKVTLAQPPGMATPQSVTVLVNGKAIGAPTPFAPEGQSGLRVTLSGQDIFTGLNEIALEFAQAQAQAYTHRYGIPVKSKPPLATYALLYRVETSER